MKMVGERKATEAMVKKIAKQEDLSKSIRMKELFDLGLEVKEIAEALDVKYNFVYNVITNYVNMNGLKIEKTKRGGKKEEIVKLFQAGKTNKEIAIELKTNYNYVHTVVKQYKQSQEEAN